MPETDKACHIQCGHQRRYQRIQRLGDHDDAPPGHAVGQRTPDEGRKGHGHGDGYHDQREGKGRIIGKPEHEPTSCDHLHAYPHEMGKSPQPQPPKVSEPEGLEHGGPKQRGDERPLFFCFEILVIDGWRCDGIQAGSFERTSRVPAVIR